jgi:lipopolysaccharide transport system permease protein
VQSELPEFAPIPESHLPEGSSLSTAAATAVPSRYESRREYSSSASPTIAESVREFWDYRELVFFLAWRDITIRYRQTVLGAIWAILQPLVTMVVFTFLFGVVVKVPTDGIPAPIFYFSALLPWLYFAATMGTASNSLVLNGDLIKKVYFPRLVLPASGALVGMMDFAIGAVILVLMMGYYHVLSLRLLLWLPLALLLWTFSFAVGVLFAAINVKYRDVKHAVPFLIQIWMFLTPVIYPAKLIPAQFAWLLQLNPLTGIIEAFRASAVPSAPFDWHSLLISAGVTLIVLLVGVAYFRRAEAAFTDIV